MIFTPLLLSGVIALASAAKAPAVPPFTKTLVSKCMTASGLKSVPTVATSTKAVKLTTTMTSFSTSTPSTTITPDPETELTVECSTSFVTETASQETDTCVLTTTFIDTATEWESSTAYETSWTTITEYSTTTPTIQPSPAWTPIYSEVVSKGKVPSKRNLIARAEENSLKINKNDELVLPPKKFPVRVNCINVVYIVYTKLKVVPASETLTITAATPTVTSTSTHVVEQTVTEFPEDATTTDYVSETSTISVTSTQWETSTIVSSTTTTSIVPAATPYYAACAPENLLTSISGSGLNRIDLTPAQTFVAAGSVPAAYDCCVAGILGGYAGAVFRPKDSQCYVLSTAGGVCDGSAKGFGVWAARAQSPVSGFVVSNGNCGSGRVVAVDGKKFA